MPPQANHLKRSIINPKNETQRFIRQRVVGGNRRYLNPPPRLKNLGRNSDRDCPRLLSLLDDILGGDELLKVE